MIYVSIALLISAWGLLWYMRRDTLRRGQDGQKIKDMENMLDDVYVAKKIRAHLDANPSGVMAGKLRKKYTRKP